MQEQIGKKKRNFYQEGNYLSVNLWGVFLFAISRKKENFRFDVKSDFKCPHEL